MSWRYKMFWRRWSSCIAAFFVHRRYSCSEDTEDAFIPWCWCSIVDKRIRVPVHPTDQSVLSSCVTSRTKILVVNVASLEHRSSVYIQTKLHSFLKDHCSSVLFLLPWSNPEKEGPNGLRCSWWRTHLVTVETKDSKVPSYLIPLGIQEH